MGHFSSVFSNKKGRDIGHGLLVETKKPWGPEEVPTALYLFNSCAQQWTNPLLRLLFHHQFPNMLLILFIFFVSPNDLSP
jgi:hypothetical protein